MRDIEFLRSWTLATYVIIYHVLDDVDCCKVLERALLTTRSISFSSKAIWFKTYISSVDKGSLIATLLILALHETTAKLILNFFNCKGKRLIHLASVWLRSICGFILLRITPLISWWHRCSVYLRLNEFNFGSVNDWFLWASVVWSLWPRRRHHKVSLHRVIHSSFWNLLRGKFLDLINFLECLNMGGIKQIVLLDCCLRRLIHFEILRPHFWVIIIHFKFILDFSNNTF